MSTRVGNIAVLLIDAHVTDASVYPEAISELGNMTNVLKHANELNIPVFEIRPCTREIGIGKICNNTNPILLQLETPNWKRIDKEALDAFYGTDLKDLLDKAGITMLVVMGQNEAYCVKATIETALKSGYAVFTSMDVLQGHAVDPYDCVSVSTHEAVKEFYETQPVLIDKYFKLPIFCDPAYILPCAFVQYARSFYSHLVRSIKNIWG